MNENDTGNGGPVNKTTKVGTKNTGFTIVASVRMHSDGGSRDVEEDLMFCLGVNQKTGEMVCWERYWIEDRGDENGWGSGRYQPYRNGGQDDAENCAINGFRDRVKWEMDACIARSLSRRDRALELKPDIDYTLED